MPTSPSDAELEALLHEVVPRALGARVTAIEPFAAQICLASSQPSRQFWPKARNHWSRLTWGK